MASTYLQRTFTTGNRKTFTFSAWVKRANLNGIYQAIITAQTADQGMFFSSTDELELYIGDATVLKTNAKYRDVNGWYNIIFAVDTTQATSSNRTKLWVNGEQVTSFALTSYPTQNNDTLFNNSGGTMRLGNHGTSSYYFDGSMAHVHFIDGTAYDASAFGETDATTGIWKPKTAPSVTYGTNGFFLKFENSGAFGTDSSGNANNFTVNGTMTQTIDTPSNVFATLNALIPSNGTTSNGNLTYATSNSASNFGYRLSTIGVSSGKYYVECKPTSGANASVIGIRSRATAEAVSHQLGYYADDYGVYVDGRKFTNNTLSSYGDSYTTGDIIGIALDLDNNYLYFHKNGTYMNSGVPTSGATGTGGISITSASSSNSGNYFFGCTNHDSSNNGTWQWNFGNGTFGTTAVSSAENPDDGIGIFEYEVPTGYKALCTKSINAQEYS